MANYALLLDCSVGNTTNDLEGVFDRVQWVSTTNSSCPDPSTTALSLNPGDQVAFAVNMTTPNVTLNWIAVMLDAVTTPGNRNQRAANNNSPFQITGSRPTILLLASDTGANVWPFTNFDAGGNLSSQGPYKGVQYLPVVRDLPPGSSTPNRNISQFEAVIVASVTDASGQMWQFGFDPEMDVNNNN